MMNLLLAASLGGLSLFRGGPGDAALRYWAVTDTFIDSREPNLNFGRDALLTGGPGKVILIRFGDLRRMVAPNQMVNSAQLVLKQELGTTPELEGIYLVRQDWGEGYGRRGMTLFPPVVEQGAKGPDFSATWAERFAGKAGLSWQGPGGNHPSDRGALEGVSMVSTDGKVFFDGLGPAVQGWLDKPWTNFGLALVFKNTVDFTSSEGHGFRPSLILDVGPAPAVKGGDLAIQSVSTFKEVKASDPGKGVYHLTASVVARDGDFSSFRVEWLASGVPIKEENGGPLKAGQNQGFSIMVPTQVVSDARKMAYEVRVTTASPDACGFNDTVKLNAPDISLNVILDTQARGELEKAAVLAGYRTPEDWLLMAIRTLNETVLRHSTFSIAPLGSPIGVTLGHISWADPRTIRVGPNTVILGKEDTPMFSSAGLDDLFREILSRLGLPNLNFGSVQNPYAGLMGGGDTRNDVEVPPILGMPAEPWFDPLLQPMLGDPTDLLSAADIAILTQRLKGEQGFSRLIPKSFVLRVMDGSGKLVSSGSLDIAPQGKPESSQSLEVKNGLVHIRSAIDSLFPPEQGGLPSGALTLVLRSNGEEAKSQLRGWQLIEAVARTGADQVLIPVRFMIPNMPVDRSANLALNKFISAAEGQDVGALTAICDGRLDTAASVSQWVEVDLGKDKNIGEIVLVWDGEPAEKTAIRTYETGQSATTSRIWAVEIAGSIMGKTRGVRDGDTVALSYNGLALRARTVRLEFSGSSGKLAEIRVYPYREPSTP